MTYQLPFGVSASARSKRVESAPAGVLQTIPILGCAPVPARANPDARGCLFEIYKDEWQGSFRTKQWNLCCSRAGVMRGVHVHADYDEFYVLAAGRAFFALRDIRRESPTFGVSAGFVWSASDGFAIPVPAGVAHAVYYLEDSAMTFGLSDYWRAEMDVLGCRWDELDPSLQWPAEVPDRISARDSNSGTYAEMIVKYEAMRRALGAHSGLAQA